MKLGSKELDALLRRWPAHALAGLADANEQDEDQPDENADAIARAALAQKKEAPGDVLDVLVAAPALAPEPGEPEMTAAGEKKMSDENVPGEPTAQTGEPPAAVSIASTGSPPPERKRQSLKDMATHASQSGARLSSPGTPPPSSVAPLSGRASIPTPRPVEAGKDDSGVINLDVVRATATAQQTAAAEKAKPGQAGLFEDEKTAESGNDSESASAAKPAATKPAAAKPASVTVLQPKKSNAGAYAGVAIAVVGIAAAVAIMARKPPPVAPVAAVEKAAAPAMTATAAAQTPTAAPAPTTVAEAAPSSAPDAKVAEAPRGTGTLGPLPTTGTAPTAATGTAVAAVSPPSGKSGDLQSEMAKAVKQDGPAKGPDQGPTPEPASAPKNQNIPEQPSQGAAQAALSPVTGAAKACVSGADDVSRATVTFSSSGAVSSVSVSGWAAAHGKSSCIQAALKGAKVGPFSKPSFTIGIPIRP